MNERIKKLTEEAVGLTPAERVELIEGLLQSLDSLDPRVDRLWVEEASDRLAAYRRGDLEPLDLDAAIAGLRHKHEQ